MRPGLSALHLQIPSIGSARTAGKPFLFRRWKGWLFCLALTSFLNGDGLTAQVPDSMQQALARIRANTPERAALLNQYAKALLDDQPLNAGTLAQELITTADALRDTNTKVDAILLFGVTKARTDDLLGALKLFQEADLLARQQKGQEWLLHRVRARINIAGIYFVQQEFRKALDYSNQTLPLILEVQDTNSLASWHQSTALAYRGLGRIDSSVIHSLKAIELYNHLGQDRAKQVAIHTLASSLTKSGNPREALDLLEKELEMAETNRDTLALRLIIPTLARSYQAIGQPSKSFQLNYRLLDILDKSQTSRAEYILAYDQLYQLHMGHQRADSALHYLQKLQELRIANLEEIKSREILELETTYQLKEKETLNQELAERNRLAQRNIVIWAAAASLFFLLFGASMILYRRLRQRNRQLVLLEEETRKLNLRLLNLLNEKKHIIGLIVHDIRTPISLIQINGKLLEKTIREDNEEAFDLIRETDRAAAQINEAVSKIMEAGNQPIDKVGIQFAVVDIRPIIQQVLKDFAPFARLSKLHLQPQLPAQPILTQADPFLLRHLLSNLLSNAIRFSPPNGKVSISAFMADSAHLRIEVRDAGPGMSQDELARVFDLAHKRSQPADKDASFWGQGLYFTRRFVVDLGGTLQLESPPGQGACFVITLPLVQS
jgi:signal transduction histidine kinase